MFALQIAKRLPTYKEEKSLLLFYVGMFYSVGVIQQIYSQHCLLNRIINFWRQLETNFVRFSSHR